jgi:4-hydroxyphenylacetate 3-monooxygenase
MVQGMESNGEHYKGYYVPNRRMLVSAQVMGQELYPEIVRRMRELAGGGLIVIPSAIDDLSDPNTRKIANLIHGSPVMEPDEKLMLLKLAWDAFGSEFAGRHMQYEMFYNGANFVTRGHNYRFYDWERAKGMVDEFLGRYCSVPHAGRGFTARRDATAAE